MPRVHRLVIGTISALLVATAHRGQALRLRMPRTYMPCSAESFRARKRAAFASHARLSSELACRYYLRGRTFAYPPQSPRVLPATRARTRCQWVWWRRAERKMRQWRRWWSACLKRVFNGV